MGVLGSFMEHLGHQNRKKDVYDGDIWNMTMILGHLGVTEGSFWGGFGAFWDDCGVTLGWLWGYVGGTLGIWRCHWVT